jgi:hypothetical protein
LGKVSFLFSGFSLLSMALVRYMVGAWVPFCWIALGLFAFFLVFAFFYDRKFFGEFLMMKTTKHGMNMGMMILLVLAFIVIVNFIAVRKYKTFDFSLAHANTLSDQSIKLLKSLDSDLKIRFFYKKGVEGNEENRRLFRDLVKKYQDQSDKVQLDFIEVNERPDLASDFGVDKGSGVVFLEYKGRRNRIDKIDEQEMSSALVKVTREKKKTVYFTSGHGELSLDDAKEARGLNGLKMLLESNNYIVKTIAFNQSPKVPQDADMLAIVGPSQGFQDFELTALEEYLKSGGSVLMALQSHQTEGLEKVVAKLGLAFQNNYIWSVVETPLGRGINQGPVMGSTFSQTNEITHSFGKDEVTLFVHPMSINRLENPPKTLAIDDIVRTNTDAMAFKTLEIKGDGPQGPFTLVTSVKGKFPGADDKAKEFAAVIAGDSDFMDNQMLFKNLNRDLVLNSIASLVKEENLISISPKEPQKTELMLTQVKFSLFIFGFIIPIPVIMLAMSVGLWVKRRNA